MLSKIINRISIPVGRRTALTLKLALLTVLILPLYTSGGISLLFPQTHAGTILDRESWSEQTNSQTVALLSVTAQERASSIGGGDITTVGEALVSDGFNRAGNSNVSPKNSRQTSIYVVRAGDTLSDIATRFDVSVDTIVWANDLDNNTIQEGKVLIILPINGVRHIVEEGDTLSGLADDYNANLSEIREYNNLSANTTLAVGAIIDIPGGEVVEEPARSTEPAPAVTVAETGQAVRDSNPVSTNGYFIHPVPSSEITQRLHGYNAVDFGAPRGSSVLAAASGTVKKSVSGGWNGGYGSFIVIEHPNGTETLYSHLSSNIVSVNQKVGQGQVIGYVGSTGRSTGPHLHFEVRGTHNPFTDCGLRTQCGS